MEIKVLDTSNPTQLAIIGRVDTVTADEFLKTMEGILQEHLQDMEWDCAEWKFLKNMDKGEKVWYNKGATQFKKCKQVYVC